MTSVALVGDRNDAVTAHRAIPLALALASEAMKTSLDHEWIDTRRLTDPIGNVLSRFAGIWCVPASPYENMEGVLSAIRFARETVRPFLGTCGGFQHAMIEYFRNALHQGEAGHAETNHTAAMPVIAPLECSLVEKTGDIVFAEGSALARIYGTGIAHEGYHCSYGFNETYRTLVDQSEMSFSGFDEEGAPRAFELAAHPFFIATLFQPERSGLTGASHPLISAFVQAAAECTVSE